MSVAWYWAENGRREGPMDWERLRKGAKAGEFTPEAWVWTPGFGAEWRKASTLGEAVFAKTAAPRPAGAEGEDGGQRGEEDPAAATAVGADDVSPFDDTGTDSGGRVQPVSVLRSLAVAFANVGVILFKPFSFARYIAFALPALLLWLGATTGGVALPQGGALQVSQGSAGLSRLGLDGVAKPLASFAAEWAPKLDSPFSVPEPERFVEEFGNALREASRAFIAWVAAPSGKAYAVASILALLAMCAVSAWFLAKGWAFIVLRIYRRDEPMAATWAGTARFSSALFRMAFAIRVFFFALDATLVLLGARNLAAQPSGLAAATAASSMLVCLLAAKAAEAFVLGLTGDFAAPASMLERVSPWKALRIAEKSMGFALARYLLVFLPIAAIVQGCAFLAAVSIFGLFGDKAPPSLFPVFFALIVAPWRLARSLWALDMMFSRRPEMRTKTLPRIPGKYAARTTGGAGGDDAA